MSRISHTSCSEPGAPRPGCPRGFSLVELLVAIAVIALLIGLMLPALQQVRSTSERVVCSSNIRQLGLGVTMFADGNKGRIPSTVFVEAPNGDSDLLVETTRLRIGSDSRFMSRAFDEDRYSNAAAAQSDGLWDGLGYLFGEGYLESAGVFYCPSHDGDYTSELQTESWRTPGATIYGNFQYRASGPDGETRLWQIVPRQSVIVSDSLRPEDSLNHEDGANFLRADLAVLWFTDGGDKLTSASMRGTKDAWRLLDDFGTTSGGSEHTD